MLPAEARINVTRQWALDTLSAAREVGHVLLLSDERLPMEGVDWRPDEGRGLNAELDAAYAALRTTAVAIVHADLPQVTGEDLRCLIDAAALSGVAIAPDRHGSGTNALAIADGRPFAFSFGTDSCARHRAAAGEGAAIVRRPGLGFDVDTPDDWTRLMTG